MWFSKYLTLKKSARINVPGNHESEKRQLGWRGPQVEVKPLYDSRGRYPNIPKFMVSTSHISNLKLQKYRGWGSNSLVTIIKNLSINSIS